MAYTLASMLRITIARLDICRGRLEACHKETDRHGCSQLELPDWIEEARAVLAQYERDAGGDR